MDDYEYDWLQTFLPPGDQAAYDFNQNEGAEQAYQALRGAEDAANAPLTQQIQNMSSSRPLNYNDNRAANPSTAILQGLNERDGGQNRQPSGGQQQLRFAQPSSRSQHAPNDFPQSNPGSNPPNTLQEYLGNLAQARPASIAAQQHPHRKSAHNPQQGAYGTSTSDSSASTTGHQEAARRVSGGHQSTRPTTSTQAPNAAVRRGQPGPGSQYQQSVPRPGRQVQSDDGEQTQYVDPYAEISRRNQIMMMNPHKQYNWPPIPASVFQRASMGLTSNAPPPTNTPTRRLQTTPQSQPTISGRNVQRPPQSSALQANYSVPMARIDQRTEQLGQGPPHHRSINPNQITQRPSQQLNASRYTEEVETSVARINLEADSPTITPQNAAETWPTQLQHINQGFTQPPETAPPEGTMGSEPILINSSTASPVEQPATSFPGESGWFNAPVIAHAPREQPTVHRNDYGTVKPGARSHQIAETQRNQQPWGRGQNGHDMASALSTSSSPTLQAPSTHPSFYPRFKEPAEPPASNLGATPMSFAGQARPRTEQNPQTSQPHPRLQLQYRMGESMSTDEDMDLNAPPKKIRRLANNKRQPIVPNTRPLIMHGPVLWQHSSTENGSQPHTGKFLRNRWDLIESIEPGLTTDMDYDPATIAREILMATGRHPNERPLNHHLNRLQENFIRIDYKSDLQTFRWDMVDAKEARPAPADIQPPSQGATPIPIHEPMTIPAPVSAQMSNWAPPRDHAHSGPYIPSYDGARDTPPVSTRLVTDASAPPSGLATWAIGSSKTPSHLSPANINPSPVPKPISSSTPIVSIPISPRRQTSTATHTPQKSPSQPKRSTPKATPGAKQNVNATKAASKTQLGSSQVSTSPEISRLPQPRVVIAPSPEKMTGKRKPGRPPKNPANGVQVRVPQPKPFKFPVFACQWEGCLAELHNLEGIKGHVVKTHVPHHLLCQWKDCESETPMAAAEMYAHVTKEHISKLAWELGDGPSVPEPGENH